MIVTSNIFLLRATDPVTRSIALEVRFEVADRAELRALLEMPDEELTDQSAYDLDPSSVEKIVRRYQLSFDPLSMPVRLHPWHPLDEYPYKVHTGRELALMLAGAKPLAVFTDEYPSPHGKCSIPEREFEPHVTSGLIIKREQIEPPRAIVNGRSIGTRWILYALKGEEWRVEAYLSLWKAAEKSGWNEDLEREEGSLLGYEDWQNEFHINSLRARGIKDAKPPIASK